MRLELRGNRREIPLLWSGGAGQEYPHATSLLSGSIDPLEFGAQPENEK